MAISLERFVDGDGAVASRQPKYARLKDFLIDEVTQGRIQPGEALPTEREMAGTLQLALGTVRQALAELEQDGLIRREQGRGTFVNEAGHLQPRKDMGVYVLLAVNSRGVDASMWRGFELGCKKTKHHMIVCNSENNVLLQGDLILQLLQKDVTGVAIYPVASPETPYYQVAPLRDRGIPVVFCQRGVDGFSAPVIVLPHEQMGRLVGKAFAERGHRRTALFSSVPTIGSVEAFQRGMREALSAENGVLPDEFVYSGESLDIDLPGQEKQIIQSLERMLSAKKPPTAIWCVSFGLAELIYLRLQEMGLHVPRDISLVGFGDVHRTGALAQRIAIAAFDDEELGREAVRVLEEMASGDRALDDTERIVMPVQLIEGETLGQAPVRQ